MRRIAVLGANSFAGSQFIANSLSSTVQILGINRSPEGSNIFYPYKLNEYATNYQLAQLDINKHFEQISSLLNDFQPSVVVDFAGQGMVAESWQAPEQWYQTNIVSKVRLHHLLKDKAWLKKYIRISTPEVYGSCSELVSEEQNFNPSTPYAVSHAAIDMSLKAFYKQYGFPVIFTRFSNFYGAGQQLYRIIPRTIIYALTGQKLFLHGGGLAVRAFINGLDVANGINACIDKGQLGKTYHFSTDSFISIKELVELIHQQLGLDHELCVEVTDDRPGKDHQYLMSDTLARQELGWQPKINLHQGLSDCINWVKKNLDEIRSLPLDYQHKE